MGYESDTLPSHIWLSNLSYTLNFKCSTFISWSLYLPSRALTPTPHTPDTSWFPLFLRAQLQFVLVGPQSCNGGLTQLELGSKTAGWGYLRGSYLCPLFPPFRSNAGLSPGCSQFLPASLWTVSPKATSTCAGTDSAIRSGGGGPISQTPSVGQQPADW